MNTSSVLRIMSVSLAMMTLSSNIFAQDIRHETDGMVRIPAGKYAPLYKSEADTGLVQVSAFYLDVYPVTNEEFLAFVTVNPAWRRSKVKHIFADEAYLHHWNGDLNAGDAAMLQRPVTNVSWFAARAYAKWKGKRLPTLAEWEYAAAASQERAYGADEPGFNDQILAWYSEPSSGQLARTGKGDANYWGVHDMHGLVWEWVNDFNAALVTGESRADASLERKLYCGSGAVGSSDVSNYAAFMRYAFRSSLKAGYTVANLGFRCAKDEVFQ